jgi:hypothetical protein
VTATPEEVIKKACLLFGGSAEDPGPLATSKSQFNIPDCTQFDHDFHIGKSDAEQEQDIQN